MDDGAVLRGCKVRGFHHTFIEVSQILEVHEVACFSESEIVRMDAEDIVHKYPLVFSDAFPYVGGFTGLRLEIIPAWIVFIASVHPAGNGLFDASVSVVRYIEQVIFAACFGDVAVNGRDVVHRVFKQYLGHAFDAVEVIVDIYVVEAVLLILEGMV